MSWHKWSSAETLLLIENFDLYTRKELAEQLNVSEGSIKRKAYDLKLKKTTAALESIYKRPNAGQFKKGSLPHNTLSDNVISTRVDSSGRVLKYIRIGLGKWVELHHYNWKQAGRPSATGKVLIFKDGDTLNCDLSNLELISKAENMERNGPRGEVRKILQEKIVESRKSPVAKKTIAKEAKKRRAVRVISTRKGLTKKSRLAAQQAKKQAESKELLKAKVLQIELKRQARADKERKRILNDQEDKRKLPTRQIDYSQLIPLRIDHRTVVYIKPTQDPEKVMAKYGAKAKEDFINAFGHKPPEYQF